MIHVILKPKQKRTKEERDAIRALILTNSVQMYKIKSGNVLSIKTRPMKKKHPNPASKLKQIIADKILNIPDDVFLKEIKYDKYFSQKDIFENTVENQKYLRWALNRIYFDNLFEETEELAKAEKKSAKRKNSK